MQVIRPDVIVALGATAAQAMLGSGFKVTQHRGEAMRDTSWAPCVMATVHPSSLLRAPDEAARRLAIKAFEEDMRAVKKQMDQLKGRGKRAAQAARGTVEDVAWASRPSDASSSSMRSGETPKPRKRARHAREV